MSNEKKPTISALQEAKASLATARISLGELEKLRAQTRGPMPTMRQLAALLGKHIDDDTVLAHTGTLGLRRRALASGGHDVAGRASGIRFALNADKQITSITLFGDADLEKSFSAWHGPLADGLNMTSTPAAVRAALGRAAATGPHDGYTEERYLEDGVVFAFVFADDAIGLVRIRKGAK